MAWKTKLQAICGAKLICDPQGPDNCNDLGNIFNCFLLRGHSDLQRVPDDGLLDHLH